MTLWFIEELRVIAMQGYSLDFQTPLFKGALTSLQEIQSIYSTFCHQVCLIQGYTVKILSAVSMTYTVTKLRLVLVRGQKKFVLGEILTQ